MGSGFPGSTINTKLVKSSNFAVVIASLFKGSNVSKDTLVQSYKIPDSPESKHLASKVIFLNQLLELTPENVTDIYKKKIQCAIDDSTILEWFKVNGINDDILIKFLEYKPSVSSQELMDRGFKGKALGDEIKRLEIEKFKTLL